MTKGMITRSPWGPRPAQRIPGRNSFRLKVDVLREELVYINYQILKREKDIAILDLKKATRDLYAKTEREAILPLGFVSPPDSSEDEIHDNLTYIRKSIIKNHFKFCPT